MVAGATVKLEVKAPAPDSDRKFGVNGNPRIVHGRARLFYGNYVNPP
jgi:hypothetical protein